MHPSVLGRRLEVGDDLERVRAFCDGRLVADHARVWARHQTIADPEHVRTEQQLRRDRTALRVVPEPQVELRCLADYDAALGLEGGHEEDRDWVVASGANLVRSLVKLLISQTKDWWTAEGSTPTWIIYTLDEAVRTDPNEGTKRDAVACAIALLEVMADPWIIGVVDRRERLEVERRITSIDCDKSQLGETLRNIIRIWSEGSKPPDQMLNYATLQ